MNVVLSSTPTFKDFVFRKYRVAICLGTTSLIIQFIILKLLYPFPNFIPDSYGYLEAAASKSAIHVWPIGYAWFLLTLHILTSSDTAVVFVQYFLLEAAALYLIFTVLYILKPKKVVANTLILFVLINPLFLWISNYISSDALFTALSLAWISLLFWILHRPRLYHVLLQALILSFAFTVRYNALYYPLIAAVTLLISRMPWPTKITGIGLSTLLIGIFIWQNNNKYQDLTGRQQFSAFSGWQLASNALFMYSHLKTPHDTLSTEYVDLHQITVQHVDSLKHLRIRPDSVLGIYYLWNEKAPLQQYMEKKWGTGINSALYFKEWACMSNLYGSYGLALIKKHPLPYLKYYIWPNIINSFLPPSEILDYYNIEGQTVRPIARIWFGYANTSVTGFSKEIKIFKWYSTLITLANTLFIYSGIIFIFLKKFKHVNYQQLSMFFLVMIVWIANFSFSVLASPIVLRYQIFPLILFFSYGIALFEFILRNDA